MKCCRGHLCELCGNDEVIYPWDASAIACQECLAVYHRVCWSKRNHYCPKCSRIQQRLTLKSHENFDVEDSIKDIEQKESKCDISENDVDNRIVSLHRSSF